MYKETLLSAHIRQILAQVMALQLVTISGRLAMTLVVTIYVTILTEIMRILKIKIKGVESKTSQKIWRTSWG